MKMIYCKKTIYLLTLQPKYYINLLICIIYERWNIQIIVVIVVTAIQNGWSQTDWQMFGVYISINLNKAYCCCI